MLSIFSGLEGSHGSDGRNEKESDFEITEEERKNRIGILKMKAYKMRNSLKNKSRSRSDFGTSVFSEDGRDTEVVEAVNAFREVLTMEGLLPARHNDYHELLR